MKILRNITLYVSLAIALCSCATTGNQSSYSFNGMTTSSTDINDMHYYMDDDKNLAPILSNPNYNYGERLGPICNPDCRF